MREFRNLRTVLRHLWEESEWEAAEGLIVLEAHRSLQQEGGAKSALIQNTSQRGATTLPFEDLIGHLGTGVIRQRAKEW